MATEPVCFTLQAPKGMRRKPWTTAGDPHLAARYAELKNTLVRDHGMRHNLAERAITILAYFVLEFDTDARAVASLSSCDFSTVLTPGAVSRDRAARAWDRLRVRHKWTPAYCRASRKWLTRTLEIVCSDLVAAVNPMKRRGGMLVRAARSHEEVFTLHQCIPVVVRGLPESSPVYQLHLHILRQLVANLRTASRAYVLACMTWLYKFLFGSGAMGVGPWWPADMDVTPQTVCDFLRKQDPMAWIHRYSDVTASNSIQLNTMRRSMRILQIVHDRILHPSGVALRIPMPSSGGLLSERDIHDITSASSVSDCGGGCDAAREEKMRLYEAVNVVANRVVKPVDAIRDARRVYSFTPEEVYKITAASVTTKERLVVLLFLSTGLRLGGVCRLKITHAAGGAGAGAVNRTAFAIEKNHIVREVVLSPAVLALIEAWLPERGASPEGYLFPGTPDATKPVGRSTLWRVCRCVFTRAGVHGDHVHPHTFRHTTIKLLYIGLGKTFDGISKWIGHANPAVTSGVYGRLQAEEVSRMVVDDDEEGANVDRDRWRDVSRHLRDPWGVAPKQESRDDRRQRLVVGRP